MTENRRLLLYIVGLSTIALALATPSANAQEVHARDVCREMGNNAPEPLADRQGHSIFFSESSCKVMEGPTAGAVMTQSALYEWDGPTATMISAYGVDRTPGTAVAFQGLDGKIELTMTDGKPTGWTGSGHSIVTLATGNWASLKGKTISWTAKSTGPHEYEIDGTFK